MKLGVRIKGFSSIFDQSLILRMVRKTTRKALRDFGAYVRAVARNSLGDAEGVSPVGGPPNSRTGLLKRSILFGDDMARQSVVIGPIKLKGARRVTGLVPPLLEYGGSTFLSSNLWKGWAKAEYRARPFMRPALGVSLTQLPRIWANARRAVWDRAGRK